MTQSDPAHAPRPGEGTGRLPQIASPPAAPHSTGPLPPLPEATSENALVAALRRYLPAINDGKRSLRQGLAGILAAVLTDLGPKLGMDGRTGLALLDAIPDPVLQHWLGMVASGEMPLEVFLGGLVGEGFVAGFTRTLHESASRAQASGGQDPEMPSPFTVLNVINQFEANGDKIRLWLAGKVAERASELLTGGLDAHTAGQLMQLLQRVAK